MKYLTCMPFGLEPRFNLTFKYTVTDLALEFVAVHTEYIDYPLKDMFNDDSFNAVGFIRAVNLKI